MKLLMINGSPRKTGRTGIASRYITKMHDVELIDLSELEVPIFNGEREQNDLPSVKQLRTLVAEADGIIMASPEYHSGMSGALKNALDFLGSDHFANKPVALLAVAGGGKGGINALNNMRTVARGLYANAIPKQLVLDPHCFNYENDGLTDTAATQVNGLIEDLKLYVRSFSIMKA